MKKVKLQISTLKEVKGLNILIIPVYACKEIKGGGDHGNGNGIPPDGDIRKD